MAKVSLRAGAEVDFLTPKEHKEQLRKVVGDFQAWMRQTEGETLIHSAAPFKTDGTGGTSTLPDGVYGVYRVPAGFDAFLTRFTVDFEGSNASSTTSCDVRIVADAATPSALRALNNVVPTVYEASKSHAPMFRGGQRVCIAMTGGPVSTQIYVTVQVILTQRLFTDADVLSDDASE